MKNLIWLIIFIFFCNCNGQDKNPSIKKSEEKKETIKENKSADPINFLEEKFQKNGFFLPDAPLPYPSYSFYSDDLGVFSVNFIGKSKEIQNFWNIHNPSGYFRGEKDKLQAAENSKKILNSVNKNDYYIVAAHTPSKFLKIINEESEEFELNDNAVTSFYLYHGGKWDLISQEKSSAIPDDLFLFERNLIQRNQNQKNDTNTYAESSFTNDSRQKVLNGTYKSDCSVRYPSLYIVDNEGQLNFYTQNKNWVSVSVSLIQNGEKYLLKYNFLTGVSGKNKDLQWSDFSKNENVAEIIVKSNQQFELKWLGFYNEKNQIREFYETNPFSNSQKNETLKLCN